MSELLDSRGNPVDGRGNGDSREGMDIDKVLEIYAAVQQKRATMKEEPAIARLDPPSMSKVEEAIAFWKPIYFDRLVDGRHLNGIEAYELGDPKKTTKPDKAPYIAMCNLMALEAIRRMGSQMPTATEAVLLAYASEREQEIADFWKNTFHPTEFQAEWAWKACLAVLVGDDLAQTELLVDYKKQLP